MRLVLALAPSSIEVTEFGGPGPFALLTKIGSLRLAARAAQTGSFGASESSSVVVSLDNTGKRAADLLGLPLRVGAELYDDADELLFAGVVSNVDYGTTLDLTLEA